MLRLFSSPTLICEAVQHAFRAALEAQQHVAVVVELAAFDEGGEVGGEFADLQAGDVFGEVLGVRADVADAAGGAAALGVGAPARPASGRRLRCRVASQPCGYSTTTLRILPSLPAATISRASLTSG